MFYSLIVPDILLHKVLVNEWLSNKTGDLLGLTLPELLYTGKYSPLFYFHPPLSSLSGGEFKTRRIIMSHVISL